MAITLTNISQAFVEQLNRRKSYTFGSLDQMTCIYSGLTSQVDSFVPNPGSPHTSYPLMLVKDVSVTDSQPGLSEVQITYSGKLLSLNQSSFVSVPTVSEMNQEKEFQYLKRVSVSLGSTVVTTETVFPVVGSHASKLYTYKVGTATYSKRYLSNNVTYKYQANPRPSSTIFQGQAAGLTNITECGDTWNGSVNGVVTSNPNYYDTSTIIPSWGQVFVLVNFRRDSFYNWYECEESYELRYQTH